MPTPAVSASPRAATAVKPRRSSQLVQARRPTAMRSTTTSAVTVADSPLAGAKYALELQAAVDAVQLASQLCQMVQLQLSDTEKENKNDDSPVTVADYGAQALVAWALQRAAPNVPLSMVAEEDSSSLREAGGAAMLTRITGLVNQVLARVAGATPVTEADVVHLIDLGASAGGAEGRHWVLDPIDGTRGFVGRRQYAVCLGMLQEGEVVLGVLGCPNLPLGAVKDEDGGAGAAERSSQDEVGALFLAHRGQGAYCSNLWAPVSDSSSSGSSSGGGGLQRIHVKDSEKLSSARFMESYESRHSNHNFTARVAEHLGVVLPPLRMDSQVKYGLLSRGEASIFMRFPPASYREKIWDHCAGFVIVEEAGGKVTDAAGQRLDFSRGRWLDLQRGIIAAPPQVHAKLLEAVQQVAP